MGSISLFRLKGGVVVGLGGARIGGRFCFIQAYRLVKLAVTIEVSASRRGSLGEHRCANALVGVKARRRDGRAFY